MDRARMQTAWILAGIGAGLTALVAFWIAVGPAEFLFERLGVNARALQVPWAWALALAVAAGYSVYTLWAVPFVRHYVGEFSGLKALGVWVAFGSGIVEEIVFRQLLMDAADSWGLHVGWQVLLSAMLFGLAHAVWVLFSGEFRIAVPVVASTAVLGALLAAVYIVAGRNVLPAIVAHTLINLVLEPWLILGAVSGNMSPDGPAVTAAPEHHRS